MLAPNYTCPTCKAQKTIEALPVTRTTQAGRKMVVALRRTCEGCGYTDRTTMFKGALSLTTREEPGRWQPVIAPESED